MTLLFFPGGPVEIVVILLALVLLFGANKIPELARAVGQSLGQFEKGKKEAEEEIKNIADTEETDDLEVGDEETTEPKEENN